MLTFREVVGSRSNGFRGLALGLSSFGMVQALSRQTVAGLVRNPDRFLSNIRKGRSKHLKSLRECEGCVADRETRPHIRAEMEWRVVDAILKRFGGGSKKNLLRVCMFADSGLFETLVLVQKLRETARFGAIHVDLIDPSFAPFCVTRETTPEERRAIAELSPMLHNRCTDFLSWFGSQDSQHASCSVTLAVFHHASRWAVAKRPVNVVCALDWLDELGALPSGCAIQGDWLLTRLAAPPNTLIVDFNVFAHRRLAIGGRNGKPCLFDFAVCLQEEDGVTAEGKRLEALI